MFGFRWDGGGAPNAGQFDPANALAQAFRSLEASSPDALADRVPLALDMAHFTIFGHTDYGTPDRKEISIPDMTAELINETPAVLSGLLRRYEDRLLGEMEQSPDLAAIALLGIHTTIGALKHPQLKARYEALGGVDLYLGLPAAIRFQRLSSEERVSRIEPWKTDGAQSGQLLLLNLFKRLRAASTFDILAIEKPKPGEKLALSPKQLTVAGYFQEGAYVPLWAAALEADALR